MRAPGILIAALLLCLAAAFAQTTGMLRLMTPPKSPALSEEDARRVIEAQRLTEYNRAEMYQTPAGRRYLDARDAQQRLFEEMSAKYACNGCDLDWDMKWHAPVGAIFAEKHDLGDSNPAP